MLDEIRALLDQYSAWLRDKTNLREVNDWVEITTPCLDRHNDYLQIYARPENGSFLLTDDGHTIRDLELSGCNLGTSKRQELLNMTLNGFGVHRNRNSDALEVKASSDSFPLRKHSLMQAMLAVNDLFYLAEPIVKSLFYEDVVAWLDAAQIRYTPEVKFTGRSGYDHLFNFVSQNLQGSLSEFCTPSIAPTSPRLNHSFSHGATRETCARLLPVRTRFLMIQNTRLHQES